MMRQLCTVVVCLCLCAHVSARVRAPSQVGVPMCMCARTCAIACMLRHPCAQNVVLLYCRVLLTHDLFPLELKDASV